MDRLHIAAEDFQRSLAKKKDSDAMDAGEKITRIDALGIVMIKNGEEYGEDSGYGMSGSRSRSVAVVIRLFSMQGRR